MRRASVLAGSLPWLALFRGGSGNVFAIRNIQFSKSAEADKKSPSLSLPKK
jgi:hypothetical protein